MEGTRVVVFSSMKEVPAEHWDSILRAEDIFHTHRFIRVAETSNIENSKYWPVCFYEKNDLVGTAVVTALRLDLGLFLGQGATRILQNIRRVFPRFLRPKVLFCGIPVSLGQSNLVIARASSAEWIVAALHGEMEKIAKQENVNFFVWKEFNEHLTQSISSLKSLGYLFSPSLPYMTMDVSWRSFDEYLNHLRHGYRRQIKKSLRKVNEFPDDPGPGLRPPPFVRVRLNDWENCPPELFHEYYLEVMNRASDKLEILNLKFFQRVFTELREDLELLTISREEEVLGAALLFKHPPYLTFGLVANKYPEFPQADPYFNLVYAILREAIQGNYDELKLGQTAYWVKQRVGGVPANRYLLFRASNKWVHWIFVRLQSVLFPSVSLKPMKVFKSIPE
jgi:predicted N-acyltransferase